ncbi:MAG TPA: cytochrome c oxidase subunit II [Vicinamibacterales bacterium]|nr:cytochrome c oxidase subunit II [Vicinamibacterales bacterium]
MHVELYERIWMWGSGALIVVFLGVILTTAAMQSAAPPSHIETVDPAALDAHPEFGAPGVTEMPDGRVKAVIVAATFFYTPDPIEVPAGRPVLFRVTSSDVIHGFHIVGTNANAMAIPGYVSQFTLTFDRPGEYLITCNEYCGLMHHAMVGTLLVRGGRP